jgi:hypothetical protein
MLDNNSDYVLISYEGPNDWPTINGDEEVVTIVTLRLMAMRK